MVSYIYRYIDGVKSDNIGFGKIDMYGNQIKVNITLRYTKEKEYLKVYFFVKEGSATKLIYIGEGEVKRTGFELKNNMDIAEVTEGKYNVNNLHGIVITEQEKIKYVSFWQQEYVIKSFEEFQKPEEQSIEIDEEDTIYLIDKNCVLADKNNSVDVEKLNVLENENIESECKNTEECNDNVELDELIECNEHEQFDGNENSDEVSNSMMCRYYSKEFVKKIMVDGVPRPVCEIMPKDIYHLPRECWCCGKNSFACHGFMNHGKLFLVEDDGIYFAVPGYQTKNDEIAAKKYGFNRFMQCDIECLKESSSPKWHRGFWCRQIVSE